MAKRFSSTDIWDEDWFLELPTEYKLFWFYLLSNCDHAGVFKITVRKFSALTGLEIDSEIAFELINKGKVRLRKVNGNSLLIEEFFCYQYGHSFNGNNRLHESIAKVYDKVGVNLTSIRGLKVVKDRVKDKDKE